jgi:uncharacterized protein (TIGR03086 family)
VSDVAARWRKVADAFQDRIDGVPDGGWEQPAPCEGWVARDVVTHLEWVPGFFDDWGIEFPERPDDPAQAWRVVDDTIQAGLSDATVAAVEHDTPVGRMTFAEAVDTFVLGDVLVHTWDLARATGQDEALDPDEVHHTYVRMQPADEMIRGEHFGPKVAVPDDADEQTKLLAFVGRTP